ncbi:oxidative stress defense protein [Edwardsiella tarda]
MKLTVLALAAMMGVGGVALNAQAAEMPEGPHVVTSGTASVDAVPDMATLTFQVSASAKDAAGAKSQVDQRVAKYFDFLKRNGIETQDISAANLYTMPEYDYQKDGKSQLKGYRAVRTVQVTLRQLDKLNNLLDGALKANLNEIRSVELGVAKPEVYREQARQMAIKNAISQAESLAQGFGVKLGPVYSIRYHVSNFQPEPVTRMYAAAPSANQTSAAQTYEQQTIHFDDRVEVVFNLNK